MALADDVRDYINFSHAFAWQNAQPNRRGNNPSPDEPALVSAFLDKNNYLKLYGILTHHLHGSARLLVNGIFTHQTPKVTRTSGGKSVEIGDLLLVQQHYTSDPKKPVSGRALLLQAKKVAQTSTGPLTAGNDAIQFDLYANWPTFEGDSRIGKYPDLSIPLPWNFKNPSAGSEPWSAGAQYLIVFDGHAYKLPQPPATGGVPSPTGPAFPALQSANFPGLSTWVNGSCASAKVPSAAVGVHCPDDFACTFEAFLRGNVGRAFKSGLLTGTDHWSVFINKMLTLATGGSTSYLYNLRKLGAAKEPRNRNLNYFATLNALSLAFQQGRDFFAQLPDEKLLATFLQNHPDATNRLMRRLMRLEGPDLWTKTPEPPVPEYSDGPEDGGHVPLLVITTVGDEPPHFE